MKRVYSNITSLGLLQVANYLIPLMVIPVITRVLGTEAFGRVSYAQNIITYLTLIVNYGFEYSATRQIAIARDEQERREIFWSVLYSKAGLLLISGAVLVVLAATTARIEADCRLYVYTWLINIGIVLFPTWYLQGVQDMQKMAWINLTIKTLGAVLVVTLVHRADQYALYPLVLSLSSIVIGAGALIYVIQHYHTGVMTVNWGELKKVLAPGGVIFINQVFVSLYTTINFTLLGAWLPDEQLGIFSGAQRIILAANACMVMPISTAFFPEMSRMYAEDKVKARGLFWRVLIGSAGISAVACVVLWLLAPWIVRILLGASFMDAVEPLRMMSVIPCLVMVATILTVQGLYGRGLQRYAPWVGGVLAILCISTNMILIPRIGMAGAIGAWILAEVCEIMLVSTILYKEKRCSI